ncbi:MAG TPA: hypothetical protein VG270_10505, partial [Pseudolabrys sp.]|nr:hypothetical protein [Pseudolabrys sp.]
LTRHLQELPWTADGLSLTQRLALQALRAGPQTVSALFRATQLDSEPLPFLGDLMPSCATCSVSPNRPSPSRRKRRHCLGCSIGSP